MANKFVEQLPMLLSRLPPAERTVWESRVEQSLHACGCAESTAGLLLGALAAIIAAVQGAVRLGNFVPGGIWLILGGAVAGAVIGKVIGRAKGRHRAHRLMAELAERVG